MGRESKLRKKGEAVYDDKYQGKKGSRKHLYGLQEKEEDSQVEEDDDEEMDDFEDLEGDGQTSAFPPSDEDDQDGEDEDIPSSAEEEQPPPQKVKKSSRSSTKSIKTTVEEDEKAMMKQMKQAASAEIDKGRDVKKQLVRTVVSYFDMRLMPADRLSVTIFSNRESRFRRLLRPSALYRQ